MYIAFEGIDGSLTASMAHVVTDYLNSMTPTRGPAISVREPTDGKIGKLLRKDLKKPIFNSRYTVTQLFAADRRELSLETDALQDEGKTIVSDRCLLSSYVYQGIEVDEDWIRQSNSYSTKPGLIYYLAVDPQTAASKVARRDDLDDEDESRLILKYKELHERYEEYKEKEHMDGVPIVHIQADDFGNALASVLRHINDMLCVLDD